MPHHPKWRICSITFNVAMRQACEEAVDAMMNHVDNAKADVLVIGLQEVAHVETLGRPICTWRQLITDWVTMRSSLVLLTKSYQATNQILVFWMKSLVPQVRRIDYRFGRNTWGGLTGHKGSIGLKISLKSKDSLVFVVSHFVHDVAAYERRILQFQSNKICAFEDDDTVKGIFWLGDLNFRLETDPLTAQKKAAKGEIDELLEKHDQLGKAITSGDAFLGFRESSIAFKPTYRFKIGTTDYDLKRTPSWCDRILFKGNSIEPESYNSLTDVKCSDHLPVLGLHTIQLEKVVGQVQCEVIFEKIPTWYSSVPVVGRFQFREEYWRKGGSYMDWVGLFPSAILDCTSALKWIWVATCYEQPYNGEKYYVCEFINVPPGQYRLGYFSNYSGCLVGLSKTFLVTDQPSD